MICLINQPAGLGDILFCLKIAYTYIDRGYNIVWPVIPQYHWINEYIKHPQLSFPIYNKNIKQLKHDIYLDLNQASIIMHSNMIMPSKYQLAGVDDYTNWVDYLKLERNYIRENELYDSLNIKEEYNLVNERFASPPHEQYIQIRPDNKLRSIYINHNNYRVFDWCKVIEEATNLYFVDTVFTLIIEILHLRATNKYLYSRNFGQAGIPTYSQTQFLFKQNWTYLHR